MASAFGHALAAFTLGKTFPKHYTGRKFWLLGIICAIWPDADVITFRWGIPYDSFWGHRGFSHSLVFALITACVVTALFYRKYLLTGRGAGYILYFFLCTTSHPLLDAMTSGGLGVAFFSPFDNHRYFLPWRPVKVSPIGVENFMGEWGRQVLLSELVWIGLPCILLLIVFIVFKRSVARH